jgi:dihydropteroate synthase
MSVFKAAYECGADILNDISSLDDDPKMIDYASKNNFPIILMHRILGDEANRVTDNNILETVNEYFYKKIENLKKHGISEERIIVDPGIGFGKTNEENIILIKDLDKLCEQKYTVLMALSRKRVIGYMTNTEVQNRLCGTLAANIISCQKGAKIVRVHDVLETIQALNVMKYLK